MAVKLLLFLLLLALPAHALELGRSLPRSACDVEFYYQHRKPGTLFGIVRSFDAKDRFKNGEMRLIIAAFLSEICRKERNDTGEVFAKASSLSGDGQRMLLWAVHLAGLEPEDVLAVTLPAQNNGTLRSQIKRSPRNLLQWDPLSSKTVVSMYLGAFFAHADMRYIDALLDTTKLMASLRKEGRIDDPLYAHTQFIAAQLYEMAQRHPCVRSHMEKRRKDFSGPEASVIDRILAGTPPGNR